MRNSALTRSLMITLIAATLALLSAACEQTEPTATPPPPAPTLTPTALPTPTPEPFTPIEQLAWYENPPDDAHRLASVALLIITYADESLGHDIAARPWVVDGITDEEADVLNDVSRLAETDAAVLDAVLAFDWINDPQVGISGPERHALRAIRAATDVDSELGLTLASLHWVADDINDDELEALEALTGIVVPGFSEQAATGDDAAGTAPALSVGQEVPTTAARVALAQELASAPWLSGSITPAENALLQDFLRLAAISDGLLIDAVTLAAANDWFADTIPNPDETRAREDNDLSRLEPLFTNAGIEDRDALKSILGYEWIVDGVDVYDRDRLNGILDVFQASGPEDTDLVNLIADYEWLTDSIDFDEQSALRSFADLLEAEGPGIATHQRTVLSFDWIIDGITSAEYNYESSRIREYVRAIRALGAEEPGTLDLFLRADWVLDGLSSIERQVIWRVFDIKTSSRALAQAVSKWPALEKSEWTHVQLSDDWLWGDFNEDYLHDLGGRQDNIDRLQTRVRRIGHVLERTPEYGWLADGISLQEASFLEVMFRSCTSQCSSNAVSIMDHPWFHEELDHLDFVFMRAMLASELHDATIREQDWFRDGSISEADALRLLALTDAKGRSEHQYNDLLRQHDIAKTTITLPLGGETNLYIVRHTPFPEDDPTIDLTEDIITQIERFMGSPYPNENIVILIIEPSIVEDESLWFRVGYSHDMFSALAAPRYNPDYHLAVFHEMTHQYWSGVRSPGWWNEGVAGFLPNIARDVLGHEPLEVRHENLRADTERECWNHGIGNVSDYYQLQEQDRKAASERGICVYALGEIFLMDMYLLLGKDATVAALRDVHQDLLGGDWGYWLTDQGIYDVFAEHVPEGMMDEFHDLFAQRHGGANVTIPESPPA